MLNREKYKNNIIDIASSGYAFAMNKKTKQLVECEGLDCSQCEFYEVNIENGESLLSYDELDYDCHGRRENWCNSEVAND